MKLFSSITTSVAGLLFAIVGAEAILLLIVFEFGYAPLEQFDHRLYDRLANNLLDHGTFASEEMPPLRPTLYRTPGYPLFIAGIYALAGRSPMAVYVVQFIMLWVAGILIVLIGKRFFSH